MSRGETPVTAGESSSTTDARKAKRKKQSSTSIWTKPVVLNDQISREQPQQCGAAPLDAPQWLQWMTPTRGWYPGSKAAGGAAKAPKGSQPKAPKQPHMRSCSEMESPFDFAEGAFCGVTQLCTRRPGHNAPPRPGPHWGEYAQAEYSAANPANPLARLPQGVCSEAPPAPGGAALRAPTGAPTNPHWLQGLPPSPTHWFGGRPAFDTQQQQQHPFATQQQHPFATQQQQPFATHQQQQPFATQQPQPFATQQQQHFATQHQQPFAIQQPFAMQQAAFTGSVSSFGSDSSFHSSPEMHTVHAVPLNATPPKYVPPNAFPPPHSPYNDPGRSDTVADESIFSLLVDDVMRDGSMDGLMHAADMGEEVYDSMASFEVPCHPHAQSQPQISSDDAVRLAMVALAKAKRQKAVELMAEAKEHEDAMMLAFHGLV